MTTTLAADRPTSAPARTPRLKLLAGVSLLLAGLLNGLPQYLIELLTSDQADFSEQIRWSIDHRGVHVAEQVALLLSTLFMPIGVLGLAWVAHHSRPRLTAVATVLAVWGMWGFHNVLAMGYVSGTVAPEAVGVDAAVRLNDGLIEDPGTLLTALLPHLVGSFFGLILLAVACWRSGAFPRTPLVLMVVFLVWDFALPADPPFEPHLLLVVAWCWLGVHLLRMPSDVWRGREAPHDATTATY
jgi:hypothetical protein